MKEINVDKIKNIKKPKFEDSFGVSIKGRGRLGTTDLYIPEVKTAKTKQQNINSNIIKETNNEAEQEAKITCAESGAEELKEVKEETKPVSCEDRDGAESALVEAKPKRSLVLRKKKDSDKPKKTVAVAVREAVELFKVEETTRVVSVDSKEKKRKLSPGTIPTVVLMLVLMMFLGINNVQYFENQKIISELEAAIEKGEAEERKLTMEFEQKYDLSQVGDYASSELGMVGSENSKKVYIDIDEDESVEVYEPETEDYGTIVTIMNALGDTFKAWIDVFG